jgi:hypothetical protein
MAGGGGLGGGSGRCDTTNTIHPTPYTQHPKTYSIQPTPYTQHPTPNTIHHTPYTMHHTPYTIHHTPYTIHHTPYTIHHTPCTLHNTPPWTLQGHLTPPPHLGQTARPPLSSNNCLCLVASLSGSTVDPLEYTLNPTSCTLTALYQKRIRCKPFWQ